jgi:hypothetical protein
MGVTASKDHPGLGAIAVYVDPSASVSIPASIGGVATVVLPVNGTDSVSNTTAAQPRAASLSLALAVKQRNAASLFKANPALFGVGIGQSLDNPTDAAVILFADRKRFSGNLPESIEGVRVRTILMDRLHVTRSHGSPGRNTGSCLSSHAANSDTEGDMGPLDWSRDPMKSDQLNPPE